MGRQDYETEALIPVGGFFDVAHSLRAEGHDASEDGTGRGTPIVPVGYTIHGTNKTARVASETDIAGSIRTKAPGSIENSSTTVVAFQTRIARNGRGQPKEVTDALTSCNGGTHADSKPHVAGSFGVRRLTPRECERLQGFPDDYTLIKYRGKPAADAPRYRALGNSMARPVMLWIGQRVELALTAAQAVTE